ncbi:MAG TPA: hypothetical protein PKA31_03260 [Candidatus Moranbacteria bacterium]|nr:hypothetical protein [Candidatus Moranbacteria bacterium]
MFHLIKLIISLVGLVTIAYFLLPRFGYELNVNYFTESKEECQARLDACAKEVVRQGTQNAKCDFNCMDPKLIIKRTK